MGLDITALIVGWEHLTETPPGERLRLLKASVLALDDWDCDWWGWAWPSAAPVPWFATYEFKLGLGSFKPHFWAGDAWEDVRDFADPALRAALDGFLAGLVWEGPGGDAVHVDSGVFPDDEQVLLARTPEAVSDLATLWAAAVPLLDGLREPFNGHAADPGGWFPDFEPFGELARGWGEVVGEADRRGWGLIGLPL